MTKRVKHKYKVGEVVYYRPDFGFRVYKCTVDQAHHHVANVPYYSLVDYNNPNKVVKFIAFEHDMSKRAQRLVREAKKRLEEEFSGYIQTYQNCLESLNNLLE